MKFNCQRKSSFFLPKLNLAKSKSASSFKLLTLLLRSELSLFVAVDCEMDQSNGKNYICKISIVDEEGTILLDTLVNPQVPITYSLYRIHGIKQEWLKTAPSLTSVK